MCKLWSEAGREKIIYNKMELKYFIIITIDGYNNNDILIITVL